MFPEPFLIPLGCIRLNGLRKIPRVCLPAKEGLNAVEALGTIADFPLLDAYLLEGEKHYMLYVRARLDIEALPSPLRPLAYLSSLWRLESEWYRWQPGS